jgi:hypothetical protein
MGEKDTPNHSKPVDFDRHARITCVPFIRPMTVLLDNHFLKIRSNIPLIFANFFSNCVVPFTFDPDGLR